MSEIIYETIKDSDGVDCYIKRGEVVRCKDCKHRQEDECPMFFEEQIDIDEGDGYYDTNHIFHDYTQDDGYCSWGERRDP